MCNVDNLGWANLIPHINIATLNSPISKDGKSACNASQGGINVDPRPGVFP